MLHAFFTFFSLMPELLYVYSFHKSHISFAHISPYFSLFNQDDNIIVGYRKPLLYFFIAYAIYFIVSNMSEAAGPSNEPSTRFVYLINDIQ